MNNKIPKQKKSKLSITLETDVNKILEDLNFNKSKLINKLLRDYINKIKTR